MQIVNGTINASNFQEALEQAKMDFEIGLSPLFTTTNQGEMLPVSGHFATYRKDNGQPLNSVVGRKYEIINHNQLHGVVDPIVQPLGAKIVNAGFLKGGNLFFFQSKMPDTWKVGNKDLIESYFTITGSHDGTRNLCVGFSNLRIICQNSFVLASEQASKTLNVHHTRNATVQLAESSSIIKALLEYQSGVRVKANQMLNTKFTDAQMDIALNKIFNEKDSKKAQNDMEKIREHFVNGIGIDASNRGSLWAGINSISQFSDWDRTVKKEKENPLARFESNLLGTSAQFKIRAFNVLEQVASQNL